MPRTTAVVIATACVLLAAVSTGFDAHSATLPQVEGVQLIVSTPAGEECFCVSRSESESRRQVGLSPDGDPSPFDAMLFTWTSATTPGFWMKNTANALDIAFVAQDGTVAKVESMPPCTTAACDTYRSPVPTKLVVEAPDLTRMGIVEGVRVRVGEPCKVSADE